MGKRKSYSPEFKAKVALEAIKGGRLSRKVCLYSSENLSSNRT